MKGLAHSRPTDELAALDLTDKAKVEGLISSFKPDWVIHCAAERRPDVAAKVISRSSADLCRPAKMLMISI